MAANKSNAKLAVDMADENMNVDVEKEANVKKTVEKERPLDKDDIIVKLDKYLKRLHANEDDGYIDRNSEDTLYIPSCQQPQVHSITIQYRNDNVYLRIAMRDCGYCHDCESKLHVLRHQSDFEHVLYVPLKAVAISEPSFANISTELLRNIVYKTSNLYVGYSGRGY